MALSTNVVLNFLADTKQIEGKVNTLKTSFMDVAKVGAIAFAGISAGIISTIKPFSEFEKGVTNVFTLLGKTELNNFGSDLKKVAKDAIGMGFAIEDSNKALFDTVSALGAGAKSLKTFTIAQKLAIGGVTSLSVSVDGLTSVINAYGKETVVASDVANAFFSAQKAGKTTVGELAANVGKIAPIAKQAGIGFKTLLATMSQLTLGGLSTEEASTALKGAIAGLLKPTEQAISVMKKYNIPIGASALKSADFTEVLKKLAIAAKENPDALAEMIPNIRALTAVGALGEAEIENLRKTIVNINSDIENGTGLNEAYAKQLETFSFAIKLLVGNLNVLRISFGAFFAEKLKPAIQIVTDFIKKLNQMSERTKNNIATLVLFGAGISGAVAFVGIFGSALLIMTGQVINATKAIGALGIGFNALKAQLILNTIFVKQFTLTKLISSFGLLTKAIWGSVFSLRALKVAMVATGIGALIVAVGTLFVAWQKNWGGIQEKTANVLEFLRIVFADTIKFWFDLFKNFFTNVLGGFVSFANDTLLVVEDLLNGIRKLFGKEDISLIASVQTVAGAWADEWNMAIDNVSNRRKKSTDDAKEKEEEEAKTAKEIADAKNKNLKDASNEKVIMTQEEAAQILAIKTAANEAELLAIEEKLLLEKDLRFADLENKIIEWETEGLAKTEILKQFNEQEALINEEFAGRLAAIEAKKQGAKKATSKLNKVLNSESVKDTGATLNNLATLSKNNATIQKGIGIGKATINVAEGITKALTLPFPANIAAAAKVATAGAVQIAQIGATSFAVGTDKVPNDMLANIHAGEIVVPAREAQFLRSGDLQLSAPDAVTNNQNSSSNMDINIIVEGSLIGSTPEELARSLHDMISDDIISRTLSPFPTTAQ